MKRRQDNSADDPKPAGKLARHRVSEKDIVGLEYLKRAYSLFGALHDIGCDRDTAGNRLLFYDDYCKAILLYTWNPLIESVHDLQQALGLRKVAKALGVRRFSAGSFSESVRVFDPERLKPIILELAGELAPGGGDPWLKEFKHALTLVDGTVVRALTRLAKSAVGLDARYNTSRDGVPVYGWRLHTQLDLETFTPHRIDRTGARNAGEAREQNVLRRTLEPQRCYVADGGYDDRTLFADIVKAGSSFVIRGRENAVFDVVEERLLSDEALKAGIVRDAIISLPGEHGPVVVRRIEIEVAPHLRRLRCGWTEVDLIALNTSLLDLPAELVAVIYRYRYTVELFFRTLKQTLGMRHLLSQRQEGLDIQIYCTVIACILMQLIGGKKPSKAMRNMLGWYMLGLATEADVRAFINRPDNTGVKLRAKEELWKKLGF